MNAEQIAELAVSHFNDLADKPIVYQATKPDAVAEAQKETSDWQVFVLPYGESETPIDRGDACREERVISVVVNGPVKGQLTRAKGLELVDFLRSSFRELYLGDFRWDGNEVVSIYDTDALKTKAQFLSLFRATFYRFA